MPPHGPALLNEIRPWGVVRQGGVLGTGIIGTAYRQVVVRRGRLHNSAFATPICRFGGSALHVMLFLENLIRVLLIFNGLRSRYCQRALLVYHYPLEALDMTVHERNR